MTKFRPLVNSFVTETEFTNMSDMFLEMDVFKKYQCAVNYFTELSKFITAFELCKEYFYF